MIKLFLIALLFFSNAKPVWLNDFEIAKQTALKEKKLILLNFSGSDWCIPCIKMHDEVFNTDAFSNYATDNLVLMNVDFPRKNKNKLSKEQRAGNDKLADKYNPGGSFPLTILLDANGNKIKIWDGFYKNGVQNFIEEIKAVSVN
jgi:thioredoxin-related protein